MHCKSRWSFALFLFLLMAVPPLHASPDEGGSAKWLDMTITTTNGQTHRHVVLEWVNGGRSLLVTRPDGAIRDFTYDQISDIRDADGVDRANEVLAARQVANQKVYPAGIGAEKPPNPWLFNWTVGWGVGYAGTIGGDFPESKAQWVPGGSIRRRIYKNNYLNLSSNNQYLATQDLVAWDHGPAVPIPHPYQVEWTEDQLFLSFGHYYESRAWYWEAGVGALLRTLQDSLNDDDYENTYLKGGLRLRAGMMVPVHGPFALDLAAYVTFKPGFRDTRGGLAMDVGLRVEAMVW